MARKEAEAESGKELASQLAEQEVWHIHVRHHAHLKHWAWVDTV